MIDKIKSLLQEVEKIKAANAEELEALRIKYLSKKGEISMLMNDFRNVPAEQKREVGKFINELKETAQNKINELKESFENTQTINNDIDLTRSAYPLELGTRHPLSLVKKEICDIFGRLGFSIAEGPEIEDDWHVFSSLNFAEDHPARDMQDTFFIQHNPDVLLRTHTSSVQSRVMEKQEPPIRIICPGRVYRNEAISYRAHCFFHQVEALYVDKNVSFADLKQALLFFAKECLVRKPRFVCVRLISHLQSHQQKWIFHATYVVVKDVHSVNIPDGLRSWVVVWSIRMYWRIVVSTAKFIQAMRLEWVSKELQT